LSSPDARVRSALFSMRFDPAVLRFASWERSPGTDGVLAVVVARRSGEVHGGFATADAIPQDRDLLVVNLTVLDPAAEPEVTFTRSFLDDLPAAASTRGRDDEQAAPPARFVLGQNYPNPFNAATRIRVGVPNANLAEAVLRIYDTQGREVRRIDLSKLRPGYHDVLWDGMDGQGRMVSSGVYFYGVRWRGEETARKMILVE
jgi:hypothetical protein